MQIKGIDIADLVIRKNYFKQEYMSH